MFRTIVPSDTKIDFLRHARPATAVSILIILAGLASALIQGVRWGIDFAGGTEMQVRFEAGTNFEEGAVRSAVEAAGVEEPTVVRFGEPGSGEFQIRFAGGGEGEEKQGQLVDRIRSVLTEQVGPVEIDRVEYVGPKVGEELRRDGAKAMLLAWLLILAYVGLRFNLQFAPGGVVALIHDVLVTAAIWQLLGQTFDLQVLAALLAIVGYSINDTIVIFDRIRELVATHTTVDIHELTNRAVNQTLSRTILTSLLTLLAVIALLALAGPVVFPFTASMGIGILVGTYSTIYVASPVMLAMERWRGRRAAKQQKSTRKHPKAAARA